MRFLSFTMLFFLITISIVLAKTQNTIKDDDIVIAKVNNERIYKSGIDAIIDDFQKTGTIIDDKTRDTLITRLVEQKLVAQFARKQGYDQKKAVQRQIEIMTEMVLRDSYFSNLVNKHVTPQAIKLEFDKKMARFKPKFEYKASHILVDTEEKAKNIRVELDNGKSFSDLAKKYSSDANAQIGGDLGYFSAEMMVESFSDTVANLSINQISQPVRTDFGWHIIQLVDKRELPKPTLEQLTQQIQAQLARGFMEKNIAELKSKSDIKIYPFPKGQ